MKGIILAGGFGTRLLPLTKVTNKHLLPVYKKPMIMYPLETLLNAGIKDILFILGPEHAGDFLNLLGSGKDFGARFTYEIQSEALGTANALSLAETFADNSNFAVVLGDNILPFSIKDEIQSFEKKSKFFLGQIFLKEVENPTKYGVVTFAGEKITSIEEKPSKPKSNFAITGVYCFSPEIFSLMKKLKKSERNEFELTDLLNLLAKQGKLSFSILKQSWTDAGDFDSYFKAINLLQKLDLDGKLNE